MQLSKFSTRRPELSRGRGQAPRSCPLEAPTLSAEIKNDDSISQSRSGHTPAPKTRAHEQPPDITRQLARPAPDWPEVTLCGGFKFAYE